MILDSGTGELTTRRFNKAVAARLVSNQANGGQVVFTRLISEPNFELGDISPEDAFSVHVNCIDLGLLNIKRSRSTIEKHSIPLHGIAIYDLGDLKPMSMDSRFDMVRLYFPRSCLRQTAREMGSSSEVMLKQPYLGFLDPFFAHISGMLKAMFQQPERVSRLVIDQLGLMAQAHLIHNYSDASIEPARKRGGLSSWQERRAKELIDAELATVSLARVAAECGLSVGHFTKAFRETTGVPPYRWMSERRVEKVMDYLSRTREPLSVIATACGYADQSHMGRAFLKHTGIAPGEWRRRFVRLIDL